MQLPDNVSVWLKLLLSLTSRDDISIRKNAIAALKQNLPTILSNKQKIIASCATFLKEVSVFLLFFEFQWKIQFERQNEQCFANFSWVLKKYKIGIHFGSS